MPSSGPSPVFDSFDVGSVSLYTSSVGHNNRSAASHGMSNSEASLYDSGRFSLWFRVPALTFGLFALWLAAAIACHGVFGVSLGIPMSDVRGSSLLGSLAGFVIAALWIFLWFAQLQILFDDSRQQLVVRTKGYFRSHDRRVALSGSREVQIRRVSTGLAGRTWRVTVEFTDGRSEHVTDLASGVEALAESVEAVTKVPVRRYEFAA